MAPPRSGYAAASPQSSNVMLSRSQFAAAGGAEADYDGYAAAAVAMTTARANGLSPLVTIRQVRIAA